MDPVTYSAETASPFEETFRLTRKGEALVHLMKLSRLLAEMSPSERAELRTMMVEMIDEFEQAA